MTLSDELAARARVLIIDDEQPNVRLLERLLLTGGFTDVHGCTDPLDAIARFGDLRPDIVMLDLHMPKMDGFAVLKALRERCPPGDYLPIVVLTADMTREARERRQRLHNKTAGARRSAAAHPQSARNAIPAPGPQGRKPGARSQAGAPGVP
jgi:CheY-like chemotaxis protein